MTEVFEKLDEIIEPLQSLGFNLVRQKTTVFDTKFGGLPYWPVEMEYPTDEDDEPMSLLAQLNFNKLPKVKNFPTFGILQFFISSTDCYGADFDDLTDQKNFRIIYHKDIREDNLLDTLPKHSDDYVEELPFEGEYLLVPLEVSEMRIDAYDYRFDDLVKSIYNELTDDEKINTIYDLDTKDTDACFNRNERTTVFIGGYPIFTQDDPRDYNDDIRDCNIVLFESDSIYKKSEDIVIEWGDSGTGTFLIPLENLKNLDFSKVAYNFDCC